MKMMKSDDKMTQYKKQKRTLKSKIRGFDEPHAQ